MKPLPESRSPPCSPTQHRRLSIRMKPPHKAKSPDLLTVPPRHLVLKQLTSTLTKSDSPATTSKKGERTKPSYRSPSVQRTSVRSRVNEFERAVGHKKSGNISGISPIKEEKTRIPPKVVITGAQPLVVEESHPKVVPRSKVKSPYNVKVPIGARVSQRRQTYLVKDHEKEATTSTKTRASTKLDDVNLQVKKKETEIVNLTRKLNTVQKTLVDKEKALKDLEIKIPKMLGDLKKDLQNKETNKKTNRDLKESMKRNRNLSGSMQKTEEELKVKEVQWKEALEGKKKVEMRLKSKEKECKDSTNKISSLECNILDLERQVKKYELEMARERELKKDLEAKYIKLYNENNVKDELIETIRTESFHLGNVAASRENEIAALQQQNSELVTLLQVKEEKIIKLLRYHAENSANLRKFGSNLSEQETPKLSDSRDDEELDDNDDFFARIGGLARERNVSVNLKVTLRKSQGSSNLRGGACNLEETSGSFKASILTEVADHVFLESELFEDNSVDDILDGDFTADDSVFSTTCSEYSRASSTTCRRLSELDAKVQGLWKKLSANDDPLLQEKVTFQDSVLRMEEDLNQSVMRHKELVSRVNVVKRLFD